MNKEIIGKEIIKRRKLNVKGLENEETRKLIKKLIINLDGIKHVTIDRDAKMIHLKYNLLKIKLRFIESILGRSGFKVTGNFFNRLNRSWIYFTENNEYDNHVYPTAHCCNVTKGGTVYNSSYGINTENNRYTTSK